MDTVSFTRMEDGTVEDWALIESHESEFFAALPDRILAALEKLRDSFGGYQVTRYTHSLQAATRALRDGRTRSTSSRRSFTTSVTISLRTPTARWWRRSSSRSSARSCAGW